MKAIPVFFENLKRAAIVIKPKDPFKNWLYSIDPKDRNLELEDDIYLIPDFDDKNQVEKWLNKNYDDIFCDQMNHWYIDDSLWVKSRSIKMFKEWFDYSIHIMIWDTLDSEIEKE